MTTLGFATGLRPSSLRPLRRRGSTPDVLWTDGVILVRRSQTIGEEVMERTKQGTRYRIALPEALMDILRWHVEQLRGHRQESDLLFPGRHGGFMSTTALTKPFKGVVDHLKLGRTLTPKGMRRTFQDLARHARVDGLVQRAICGHATEEMTELYSTVRAGEIRDAVGRLLDVAGLEPLVEPRGASWCESGVIAARPALPALTGDVPSTRT
jgi:integrase